MVGSAQYRDDEIGWILAAVVARKKQDFIKQHFENRFGRPLNHNQIRYIKNKYGKDPRFNSPLVNIRPCADAASPSDTLDSNDPDEIIPIPTIPLPDDLTPPPHPHSQNVGQPKRKRALEVEDESNASSSKRQVRKQCEEALPPPSISDPPLREDLVSSVPRWDPAGPRLSSTLHSLLPPLATPRASSRNASMYGISQQLVQDIGGLNWASLRDGPWTFDECSNLMSPSSQLVSAAFQDIAATPSGFSQGLMQTSPPCSALDLSLGSCVSLSQGALPCPSYAAPLHCSPSMSPIDLASNASPPMESSLPMSMNRAPQSTPSVPPRNITNDSILHPSVNINSQYQSPQVSQLQEPDCRMPNHDWSHQSSFSGLDQLSQLRGNPSTWDGRMAGSGEIAGVAFDQADFPAYLPILSTKGHPDISSNYILSSGATAYSSLPPPIMRQPLLAALNSFDLNWLSPTAHKESLSAVPMADNLRQVQDFDWQLQGPRTRTADVQQSASVGAGQAVQGFAGSYGGMIDAAEHGLFQDMPLQNAQWITTTTGYSPNLSSTGVTDFSSTLASAAQAPRCENAINDDIIDPSLLEAFDLEGDMFGMTCDTVVSNTC